MSRSSARDYEPGLGNAGHRKHQNHDWGSRRDRKDRSRDRTTDKNRSHARRSSEKDWRSEKDTHTSSRRHTGKRARSRERDIAIDAARSRKRTQIVSWRNGGLTLKQQQERLRADSERRREREARAERIERQAAIAERTMAVFFYKGEPFRTAVQRSRNYREDRGLMHELVTSSWGPRQPDVPAEWEGSDDGVAEAATEADVEMTREKEEKEIAEKETKKADRKKGTDSKRSADTEKALTTTAASSASSTAVTTAATTTLSQAQASHQARVAKEVKAAADAKADEDDKLARSIAHTLISDEGRVKLRSLYKALSKQKPDFSRMMLSHFPHQAMQALVKHQRELDKGFNWQSLLTSDVVNSCQLRGEFARCRLWIATPPPSLPDVLLHDERESADSFGLGLEAPPARTTAPTAAALTAVFDRNNGLAKRIFRCRNLTAEEQTHPRLAPQNSDWRKDTLPLYSSSPTVIATLNRFRRNFDVFTHGAVRGVELRRLGAFVAGSGVLACLLPQPNKLQRMHEIADEAATIVDKMPRLPRVLCEHIASFAGLDTQINTELAEWFGQEPAAYPHNRHRNSHSQPFWSSDVDLFLLANNEQDAADKINRLYAAIVRNLNRPTRVVRTSNAVTIVAGYPIRNIQIVVVMNRSLEELLCFCDMDCTAFAYDGQNVFAADRAIRAMNTRYNFIAPSRLKRVTTPQRIVKYSHRGFGALLFEICKHTPRCDVCIDDATLTQFRMMEAGARRPAIDFDAYSEVHIPFSQNHKLENLEENMKQHYHTCRERLRQARAMLVSSGVAMDESKDKEKEKEKESSELPFLIGTSPAEVLSVPIPNVKGIRWKRDDLIESRLADAFLPRCYVCHERYAPSETSAANLCDACTIVNRMKREAGVDLTGQVALVTGGRIKIGYFIVLSLLRNGATVIAVTRFPHDAAVRFAAEKDYADWASRLHVYGLDLRNLAGVDALIKHIITTYSRLDILINNAAQTIRRPAAYFRELLDNERKLACEGQAALTMKSYAQSMDTRDDVDSKAKAALPAHALVKRTGVSPYAPPERLLTGDAASIKGDTTLSLTLSHARAPTSSMLTDSAEMTQLAVLPEDAMVRDDENFPPGQVDDHGEPLDLRPVTSWTAKIESVPLMEVLEVQVVNQTVPFLLVQQLMPLMEKSARTPPVHSSSSKVSYAKSALSGAATHPCFIVNVSSPEGQFQLRSGNKSGEHPHTNMAKAALNMLTRTIAPDAAKKSIFVTAVDTGWVSRMRPGLPKVTSSKAPLTEQDGAARVLDPIYTGIRTGSPLHGVFIQDFKVCAW